MENESEVFVVIHEIRDDDLCFEPAYNRSSIQSLHTSQEDAESRATELDEKFGYERSGGGDGLVSEIYYAKRLVIMGAITERVMVETITREYRDEKGYVFTTRDRTSTTIDN